MGLWSRLTGRGTPSATPQPRRELFSWSPGPFLPGGTYVGTTYAVNRVTRDEALSVVGVLRGRNLICSIATLPLEMCDSTWSRTRSTLLTQIDPKVPNVVTLAMTVEDLLLESTSWWKITQYGFDGFPLHAEHTDHACVSMTPPSGFPLHTLPSGLYPHGVVWVMGSPVDGRNMIRFDSPNPPLLSYGARAIRRALRLAQAAEMYSDDPEARAFWRAVEGSAPLASEKIVEILLAYAEARRTGAEAYIGGPLERVPIDVATPADLQLVELQRRSDLEIANLMGLDPEDLGISTTSRTYANVTDRGQDRLNNVLSLYIRAIIDRLSMNDITKSGYRVIANLDAYLRADPATRWATYATALDRQVKSVPEVRQEEGLPAVPVEPRARAAEPRPRAAEGQPAS